MKKYLLILIVFVVAGCKTSSSQNADDLLTRFSKEKNAEIVTVGNFLSKLAGNYVPNLKGVESVKVLDLEECSSDVKNRFSKEVGKLKNKGYEMLVKKSDNNEESYVMVKIKDDVIHELLVITTGNEPSMVKITGKLKQSDITALTD